MRFPCVCSQTFVHHPIIRRYHPPFCSTQASPFDHHHHHHHYPWLPWSWPWASSIQESSVPFTRCWTTSTPISPSTTCPYPTTPCLERDTTRHRRRRGTTSIHCSAATRMKPRLRTSATSRMDICRRTTPCTPSRALPTAPYPKAFHTLRMSRLAARAVQLRLAMSHQHLPLECLGL